MRHQARREEVKKLATLNDDPEWWPFQLEQIKNGETLEGLATELSVKFGVFRHWILGDTKREKEYIDAHAERRKRLLAKVEDRLFEAALNPKGWPKFSDSLRAAEILRSGPAAAGGVGSGSQPVNLNIVFVGAKEGKPAIEQGVTVDQVP